MRIAAFALLALIAGVSADEFFARVDIKTLKKSEHNSDTFFADFDIYTFGKEAACTGSELNGALTVANSVNGAEVLSIIDVSTTASYIPSGYNCMGMYTFTGDLYSHVDFHNFPFDYQEHEIVIGNLIPDVHTLIQGNSNYYNLHDFHIDGWRDVAFHTTSSVVASPVTGEETQFFAFKKTIRRQFTYYLSKYISNVILLVIMSAFTAFLPINDSVRIVLSLLIFIAIIIWQIAISHKLPSAAYPNKYDQFVHISFAFLFAQFLYFTVHKAIYKESNVELKTLGEDAAEPATGMSTGKKIDVVVHGVFCLVYFIAVASVLGVGTDLDFF